MSEMNLYIRLALKGVQEFNEAVERTSRLMWQLYWAQWWRAWGTDGYKRRTALVVVP